MRPVNDSQADSLGLSSSALPLLRDLIHERVGVFYENGRYDALRDRLAPLVVERGFDSFLDYYYLLKYEEDSRGEWERVSDALAVPETYFWREMDQVRALVDVVVPSLAAAGTGPIRIWSVPCASGEEPLTIAMALDAAGWFGRAGIEIHGSDASPGQIARARAARFRERSFRALPNEMRERYFQQERDAWVPNGALKGRVTSWSVVNLMAPREVETLSGAPVIFCRNLFIYFSQQRIQQVVELLADAMPSPGYLFVGASESLLRVTRRFDLEEVGGAFVYVKR
jgi:chemotaxis protein methyltransferase CheR